MRETERLFWTWRHTGEPDDLAALHGSLLRYAECIAYELTGASLADLCTDVVNHALEHVGSFEGDSKFTTWFYRVARNRFLDKLRAYNRRREETLEIDPAAPEVNYAARIDVERLLASLNAAERQLVELHLEGLSGREIAKRLGCSEPAARQRWQKLRVRLQRQSSVSS